MTNPTDYVEIARRVIQNRGAKSERSGLTDARERQPERLETVLKGHAVELWSTSAGRLFLVADEEDARLAMEREGALRGEVYTASEVRRIIAVRDPKVAAEIHQWKRAFDGVVRENESR